MVEIRDAGTTIAAMAIKMSAADSVERRFLGHCGFPSDGSSVVLMKLSDQRATSDPYGWADLGGARTMAVAHDYIIGHFDELESGVVIDVQVILGERKTPKAAEVGIHHYAGE